MKLAARPSLRIPLLSRAMSGKTGSVLPQSSIPLFTTVASFREWRQKAYDEKKSLGFVATMGALHEGHLSLVRRSLAENDLTVLSIFVNPAQFAPHEDLTTYPRTLSQDLDRLTAQRISVPSPSTSLSITRTPDAVFLPTVREMYPSGISQDTSVQQGTFVEVKGYGDQMEGKSRPSFFRGVATVVTKLFNVIEPTNTYFGQKDIQQALLLRRLCKDLLLSHPTAANLHIIPTIRDSSDNLALSSRNAYLTPGERRVAGTLPAALRAGEKAWSEGCTKDECLMKAVEVIDVSKRDIVVQNLAAELRLDYVEMNHSETFQVICGESRRDDTASEAVILSGAMWVGKTRLIDNIILGDTNKIIS